MDAGALDSSIQLQGGKCGNGQHTAEQYQP